MKNILLFLLSITAALGQQRTSLETPVAQQALQDIGNASNIGSAVRTFDLRSVPLIGTPLLYSEWKPGSVTLVNNQVLDAQFKYDAVNRVLLILRNGNDSSLTAGYNVRSMVLRPGPNVPAQQYGRLPNIKADIPDLGMYLLKIVHSGTYSLVQLPVKKYRKAPPPSPYGEATQFNEFRDDSVYYLVRPDNTAERVKLTKKALANALGSTGGAFVKFLSTNRLDASNEVDVARALASLNP